MKKSLLYFLLFLCNISSFAQNTSIPDVAFEQALIDQNIDSDGILNGQVLTSDINTLTTLNIENSGIVSLIGIEDFSALQILEANNNSITSIDLSMLVNLIKVSLDANMLNSIDVSMLPVLDVLNLSNNNLTALDVTNNTVLRALRFEFNAVNTIDLSQNPGLRILQCVSNGMNTLDVTNNPLLELVWCRINNFTSIDLSNNPVLRLFNAHVNNLTHIDLSNNVLLETLELNGNLIQELDVSMLPNLQKVSISSMTNLYDFNIKNGNNTNITTFASVGTINLNCIQVDDVAYSNTNWTNIATANSFSTNCTSVVTYIPDAVFEQKLIDQGIDTAGVLDGYVFTADVSSVTGLGLNNAGISDLTGIEDFTSLTGLVARSNNLQTLDVSNNTLLETLFISRNNLSTIDLSANVNLKTLDCSRNGTTNLDVTNNPLLEFLFCYNNDISVLDVSNNPNLITLFCYNNDILSMDFTNNINLNSLYVHGNEITTLDVSSNTALINLHCNSTNITTLDISNNTLLERLLANDTRLGVLDVTNNTLLNSIVLNDCDELFSLNIQNGNNTAITNFESTNTPNLNCILVDDVAYSNTNWTNITNNNVFSDVGCNVSIDPKIYLQGAMLSSLDGLMRDDLRSNNHIPLTSPYTDALTMEASVLTTTGANAIVDWVWVELRDATDNTKVIKGTSALLQRDGTIVMIDGSSAISFFVPEQKDYYIAIKHRNHLGIMTANTILLSNSSTTVDFSDANNQITNGTQAQTSFGMPTNTVGMWCGNVNSDTVVQYSGTSPDTPTILSTVLNDAGNFLNFPTYAISGYNNNDVNMDGTIQYSGTNPDTPFVLQNVLAHPLNFLNFSTYQIKEQLPEN